MEDDEATQRSWVPPRSHRHCQLEEAESQCAPPPRLSGVPPLQHYWDERHSAADQQQINQRI